MNYKFQFTTFWPFTVSYKRGNFKNWEYLLDLLTFSRPLEGSTTIFRRDNFPMRQYSEISDRDNIPMWQFSDATIFRRQYSDATIFRRQFSDKIFLGKYFFDFLHVSDNFPKQIFFKIFFYFEKTLFISNVFTVSSVF